MIREFSEPFRLKSYTIAAVLTWTCVIIISLSWNLHSIRKGMLEAAQIQARTTIETDIIYRKWNSMLGGVFAYISRRVQPNAYLNSDDKIIITTDGKRLTKINPAYMNRLVHDISREETGIKSHVTSLNPLNPINAPDEWEKEALTKLESGIASASIVTQDDEQKFLRMMKPLFVTQGCLECHRHQGYKKGEIRGGINVSVPLQPYQVIEAGNIFNYSIGHGFIWLLGLFAIGFVIQRFHLHIKAHERIEQSLKQAHASADQTVKQRTSELVILNQELSAEIEKQKQLEQQLLQTQKMQSIGTLAGGIAHDFNNILFPIIGYTEMMMQDFPKDSPHSTSLDKIYSGAMRAKGLVRQILTFARQESSELKLIKMQPLIKEALKLIRSIIPAEIEIKQDISPACGVIKADPTQIHQIIMNLATNAFHAMEETGGELNVRLIKVNLEESDAKDLNLEPGEYVCLEITDTGMGMTKKIREQIFDPFFTTKELGKGTGMGLSVVHGIVKNIGGGIYVYSEPGKGTEFKLYFPAEKSTSQTHHGKARKPIQGGIEQVLLVDDEEGIITMEKQMLERLGYKVSSRTSSIEALKAFRATPEKFDIVISDLSMPNLSGDKLAAELIKIDPGIPILLCTGFSESLSEKKAASLGIGGILTKPMVMRDLAEKIRGLLDKQGDSPHDR